MSRGLSLHFSIFPVTCAQDYWVPTPWSFSGTCGCPEEEYIFRLFCSKGGHVTKLAGTGTEMVHISRSLKGEARSSLLGSSSLLGHGGDGWSWGSHFRPQDRNHVLRTATHKGQKEFKFLDSCAPRLCMLTLECYMKDKYTFLLVKPLLFWGPYISLTLGLFGLRSEWEGVPTLPDLYPPESSECGFFGNRLFEGHVRTQREGTHSGTASL